MKANQFYREFSTTGTGDRRVHNVHTAFKTSTNYTFSVLLLVVIQGSGLQQHLGLARNAHCQGSKTPFNYKKKKDPRVT